MKWPGWLYRLLPYLGRRHAEEDVQQELRLHLDLERERQRDVGVPAPKPTPSWRHGEDWEMSP